MTPFTRKTVATGAALLLAAGSALTLAAPAWGATPPVTPPAATTPPSVDTPLATTDTPVATPTDGPTAAATPAAPAAPTSPNAPSSPVAPADPPTVVLPAPPTAPDTVAPQETPSANSNETDGAARESSPAASAAPAAQADAGPAPTPVPEEVPAPDPTDPPNPDGTQISLRGFNDPEIYQEARSAVDFAGDAAPITEIRVTDTVGNLIAFGYSDSTGFFNLRVAYPQDAYTKQTVTITSSFDGDLISSIQVTFSLTPPDMERVVLSTPSPGQTITAPGSLIDVPFAGTGVVGARVLVSGYPFAGVREADLDGDYLPEFVYETFVAADGTWATTVQLEPGAYSFKANQVLDAPASSPYFPYFGADYGVEYRDLYVTSSDAPSATLPETGADTAVLPAASLLLIGAGAAGMLIARRPSGRNARGHAARG